MLVITEQKELCDRHLPFATTGEEDTRQLEQLESLVWQPENDLSKKEIDQFLVIARSVGTFARALDCTSTVRQPSLHMSAAAASRDITLVSYALFILQRLQCVVDQSYGMLTWIHACSQLSACKVFIFKRSECEAAYVLLCALYSVLLLCLFVV